MKRLFLILTVLLGITVQGYSSPNDESFTYEVLSITPCVIQNGEIYSGETTYPKDNRIVYVDEHEIYVYIQKSNIQVSFDIQTCYFEDGNLVYETIHRLSKDKVIIMVKRFENGIYTFSFINLKEKDCYIYKTEYFK